MYEAFYFIYCQVEWNRQVPWFENCVLTQPHTRRFRTLTGNHCSKRGELATDGRSSWPSCRQGVDNFSPEGSGWRGEGKGRDKQKGKGETEAGEILVQTLGSAQSPPSLWLPISSLQRLEAWMHDVQGSVHFSAATDAFNGMQLGEHQRRAWLILSLFSNA